jgi:hypothetical protein
MNILALDVLVRSFRRGEGSAQGAVPVAPVAAATAALRLADALTPTTLLLLEGRAPDDAAQDQDVLGAAPAAARRAAVAVAEAVTPPPTASSPAIATRISVTAQLVSALMQTVSSVATREPIRPLLPLVDGPPANVERLAEALRQSIASSGLFYESHLTEWALQRYARKDLDREPQAAWPLRAAQAWDASEDAMPAANLSGRGVPAPVANAVAQPHVRMQLETLETGQLRWQGDPWPRQSAFIAIDADAATPDAADLAPATRWRTRLRLALPRLGVVEATITLAGDSIGVTVRPENAAAAAHLEHAQGRLASALAARFAESGVTIGHETT